MSLLSFMVSGGGVKKFIANQSDFDNLTIEQDNKIYLKRGVTFKGDLTFNVRAKLMAYGSGNLPIIDGSIDVTGFTDNLDGTYSKTISEPDWIFDSGSLMKMSTTEYIDILGSTATNKLTINHSDVSSYSSIVGSLLIVKPFPWLAEAYKVSAYNGAGVITLDKDIRNGYTSSMVSLKLLGKVDYFVNDDEWAYEGGDLVIKSASEPTTISVTNSDSIITVNSDNVQIDEISITGFYLHGIIREAGNNLNITRCEISEGRGFGIAMTGNEQACNVQNNTIHNCGYCGITSLTTTVPNISNNTIYNIGIYDNLGFNIDSRFFYALNSGISVDAPQNDFVNYSDGGTINNNITYDIAYCGIKIRGQNNSIQYNYVYNCMQKFSDGGGIYFYGGVNPNPVVDCKFNTIQYNIIHDVNGTQEGSVINTTKPPGRAIYCDAGTSECIIRYNTAYHCDAGLQLSQGNNKHTFEFNTSFVHDRWDLWFQTNSIITTPFVNDQNIVNGNIYVSGKVGEYNIMSWIHTSNPTWSPYTDGEADNNYYINPYSAIIADEDKTPNYEDMTFSQLKTNYGADVNSIEHTDYITAPGDPDNELLIIPNPSDSVLNGSAPAGSWKDVDGVVTTNYTVQAWRSLVLLKDLP